MRAFVIRGFGKQAGVDFERVHKELIRPALTDAGVAGGDTTQVIVQAGNIRKDMFRELVMADIVVADVSVHNANVFYELGIRHAVRPRSTVLIYAKINEIMDRNFPGAEPISRLIGCTHVLIRVKSDIRLAPAGEFLPDGSYLADITGGGVTVRVRVVEYWVEVEGQDVPELFCLITDLHDHEAYPADVLAAAYKWRWDGSETALRENKSALAGAGPSTGPMLRSRTPDLIRQEHAAWIAGTELTRGLARDAARQAAPAVKGRRAGQPVHSREISFTAARRAAISGARQGTATASLPRRVVTSACRAVIAGIGRCRVTVDRDRHRDHKTKARQPFEKARRDTPTRTAAATITVCRPAA
jgi:hypothetical protein